MNEESPTTDKVKNETSSQKTSQLNENVGNDGVKTQVAFSADFNQNIKSSRETFQLNENDGYVEVNSNKRCSLRLLIMKSCYMVYFFSAGSWIPFMTVFLISIGITPSQAGLINAMRTLAACFSTILWPLITDAIGGRQVVVLAILSFCTLLTVSPLPWLAEFINSIVQEKMVDNLTDNSRNLTNDSQVSYCNTECGDNRMFYSMFGMFVALGVFETSFVGFIDSNNISLLKAYHKKATYGNQRLFGSIGFGVGSALSGIAAENFRHHTLSSYSPCLFIYAGLFLLAIPFILILSKQAENTRNNTRDNNIENEREKKLGRVILETCFKLPNFMFLLTAFVGALSNFAQLSFLLLFMDDVMKASKTTMGLSITASTVAEVLIFPFTDYFIKRFGDLECLVFGLFTNTIRFVILAFITNPWYVLPVQIFHATGFALFYAAMIHVAHRISPPEIATTMFGIVNAASPTASLIVNLVGGFMYEAIGGKILFLSLAAATCVWSIIVGVYFFCRKMPRDTC